MCSLHKSDKTAFDLVRDVQQGVDVPDVESILHSLSVRWGEPTDGVVSAPKLVSNREWITHIKSLDILLPNPYLQFIIKISIRQVLFDLDLAVDELQFAYQSINNSSEDLAYMKTISDDVSVLLDKLCFLRQSLSEKNT